MATVIGWMTMTCPYCDRETAYIDAVTALEALEPYARRLVAEAAQQGERYEQRWSLALQQARLVLRAVEAVRDERTARLVFDVSVDEVLRAVEAVKNAATD